MPPQRSAVDVFYYSAFTRGFNVVVGIAAILGASFGAYVALTSKMESSPRTWMLCLLTIGPLAGATFIWHGLSSRLEIGVYELTFHVPGYRKTVQFADVARWRTFQRRGQAVNANLIRTEATYRLAEFFDRNGKRLGVITLELDEPELAVEILTARLGPPSSGLA